MLTEAGAGAVVLKRLVGSIATAVSLAVGAAAAEPEPKRLGLPAPLDSPPFPSGDWPLGGSQLIGAPDAAVGPLMKWIYEGPQGQAWKDSHVKIYG